MRSILDSEKLRALLVAALLIASALPAVAQEAVPPAEANRLEPDGDFLFVLDGRTQRQAEVFSSKVAVVFLIVNDGLESPILVSPRTQSVESVEPASLLRHDDGTVELTDDGARGEIDRFRLDGKKVVWTMTDGRQAKRALDGERFEFSRGRAEKRPRRLLSHLHRIS